MLAVDKKHLSFKHPFTCITAGPTSSGKTVLIRRILKHKSLFFQEWFNRYS
jgi:Ni2+-binding GTPase involved in maturation of urease and hydrogenase